MIKTKKVLSYILIIFFMTVIAKSQYTVSSNNAPTSKKYTIGGITVEGNHFVTDETIIALSALYEGKTVVFPIDPNNMIFRNAIQNLWERGEFSDIVVKIDKIAGDRLFLVIIVKEWDRLSEIKIDNIDEFEDSEINALVDKNRGDIVTGNDLDMIKAKISNLYYEEGITLDSISVILNKTDTVQYSKLEIYLEEGSKLKIKKITFTGLSQLEAKDMEKAIDENDAPPWWKFWNSATLLNNKLEADRKLINDYCLEQGFIDAKVDEAKIIINEKNKTVELIYNVFEGERIYIRDVKFDGNVVFKTPALMHRLKFIKGDLYDSKHFQENLMGNEKQNDALSLYMDNGYLRANFETDEKRIGEDSVDITVSVREYDRYKINKVNIVGNNKTKDKVIRRDLFTVPGDYFNRSAIIRSLRQLNVMNYFNPESLKPEIQPSTTDETKVNITYNVEERSTDTFNASIGYAGTFGLMASIGVTLNNFSITEPWRGGGGQILNLNFEFGQASRYQNFTIGFTEPWLFDKPITVGFVVYDRLQRYSTINLKTTGATINFGKRFRWPDDYWRGDWSLRMQLNNNKFDMGASSYASYYYRSGKYTENTVEQRISRISKNHMFFPSAGSEFQYKTSFAMGSIGIGETDYIKNELKFDFYNPLMKFKGQDRLVFMLGTNLGYVTGIESEDLINQIELYRMGGNGLSGFGTVPLRGYPDNDIGSKYGNKVLSKYTAELRFAVSLDPMPIFVYGFAEAGNVWRNLEVTDPFDLKRSAGLGIQLMVQPIGMLGFSYGYGFDPSAQSLGEPTGWKFLFHLGGM